MTLIEVKNLSKRYLLHRRRQLVAQHAWKKIRRVIEPFWALRDISFRVEAGENLAIVGDNGAGKSTLLSLIAGVAHPTSGTLHRHGRVGALLEIGTGFHPDLTGRENIHLNASLLGLSRGEVSAKFDSIVAFAEMSDFLDEAVRTYSSGMVARLGFSVAIHCDPDILLLDEVFAVGDHAFQRKCIEKVSQFSAQGKTLLFVTHGLETAVSMCPRALWLERGRLRLEGRSVDVVQEYRTATASAATVAHLQHQ